MLGPTVTRNCTCGRVIGIGPHVIISASTVEPRYKLLSGPVKRSPLYPRYFTSNIPSNTVAVLYIAIEDMP